MALKEAITMGMRLNNDVTPWCVYNVKGAGRVYWNEEGIESLDEAITASNGKCDIYVSPDTFRQLALTRPDLIINSQLDTELGIFVIETARRIKRYLPETEQQQVLQAIQNGGFAAINADLRFKAEWDETPNTERGGH